MGKIKFPDNIEDWEKKSLHEDIGTPEDHLHTIYVYKDFAIEYESYHGEKGYWNPYVIVNGHPLKLDRGCFNYFDEALGYLKGLLKDKELVGYDEPDVDEPEHPTSVNVDTFKSIPMPTAWEMFAEAHALPDVEELVKSRDLHYEQMREYFQAQKAIPTEELKNRKIEEPALKPEEGEVHKKIGDVKTEGDVSPGTKEHATDRPQRRTPTDQKRRGTGADTQNTISKTSTGTRDLTPEESAARTDKNREGRIAVGKYTLDDGTIKDLGSANTHFGKAFFTAPPAEGRTPKGIYAAIQEYNNNLNNMGSDIKDKLGIGGPLPNNVGDLSLGELQQLFASAYRTKGLSGKYDAKPEYMEQLELLGMPDLSKPMFNENGSINPGSFSNLQMGRNEMLEGGTRIPRNAYTQLIHLTDTYDPSLRKRIGDSDAELEAAFDGIYGAEKPDNKAMRQFLGADLTLNQLGRLTQLLSSRARTPVTPQTLNSLMGYNFGAYENGVPQSASSAPTEPVAETAPAEPVQDIEGDPRWLEPDKNGTSKMDRFLKRMGILGKVPFTKEQADVFREANIDKMYPMFAEGGPLAMIKRPENYMPILVNAFRNPDYIKESGDENVDMETGVKTYSNPRYNIRFNPDLPNTAYKTLLNGGWMQAPAKKSFRDDMEKAIEEVDEQAGIPVGFVGIHPHMPAYKTVWVGYDKDATYPFELKNAETGEKICDVSDVPRDEKD